MANLWSLEPVHNEWNVDTSLFIGENYRPLADDSQEARDNAYLRSVNAFWCEVCNLGFCRVLISTMTGSYWYWLYQCEHCLVVVKREKEKNVRENLEVSH